MSETERELLRRALDAEDRCEALQARVDDLLGRLRGAMNWDPTSAVQALAWVGRAEQAEALLLELGQYVNQRSVDRGQFPNAYITRVEALLKTVAILRRDQAEMAEKPVGDDYWVTYVDARERRQIARRYD